MSTKKYLAIWAGSALLAAGAVTGCDSGDPMDTPATEDPAAEDLAMYDPDDNANAVAEPDTDDRYMADDPSMTDEGAYGSSQSGQSGAGLGTMSVDDIIGETVLSSSGEEIGEIEDVVIDGIAGTGGKQYAVVDVGGFLGVSERSVVVPFDKLQVADDGRIQSDLTRESVEALEEYNPDAYEAEPEAL